MLVYLRVLCSDGTQDSDWVTTEVFVSATNDPPSVPVLLNPADGVGLAEEQRLESTLSVDPEGEDVTHDLMVMDLRDRVVAEAMAVEADGDVVSWDPGVLESGYYQWSSRAVDASGVESEWAEPRSFYVGSPEYADQPELDGVEDFSKTEGCAAQSRRAVSGRGGCSEPSDCFSGGSGLAAEAVEPRVAGSRGRSLAAPGAGPWPGSLRSSSRYLHGAARSLRRLHRARVGPQRLGCPGFGWPHA